MNRRQLLAAAPMLATPALVQAQPAWPNRTVRIVIPFTPGGASDLMMRPVQGEQARWAPVVRASGASM